LRAENATNNEQRRYPTEEIIPFQKEYNKQSDTKTGGDGLSAIASNRSYGLSKC
jgi:hypothetical protein